MRWQNLLEFRKKVGWRTIIVLLSFNLFFLAIIKYMCAELGASKEKTTILKGQHNYETLLKTLDK